MLGPPPAAACCDKSVLPPSPFETVACPLAVAFLIAFYFLHALYVWDAAKMTDDQRREEFCVRLHGYGAWTLTCAALGVALHFSLIIPNWMRWGLLSRASKTRGVSGQASGDSILPLLCAPLSVSRAMVLVPYCALYLLQRVVWCLGLVVQLLAISWEEWLLLDAHLNSMRGPVPLQPACASLSKQNAIRWHLVCIVVTSATSIVLLVAVAQEAFGCLKQALAIRRKRRGGAASRLSPHSASSRSAWLDLQGDEARGTPDDEDERDVQL